nr:XRE family transcriptional regulator [Agrobacterium larrymoorei]
MESDATNIEHAIAEKISGLRTSRGMTLDQLAQASSVSRAMISRIERGEATPTAALLARICSAFGMTLSRFFTDDDEQAKPLLRYTEQPTWKDPETGYVRRAVSPPGAGSPVDIVDVMLPTGARVSFPPHAASRGMNQYVWLLEGVLDMTTGGETHRLEAGDCLFMPVGEGHSFHNPSSKTARYAVVLDQRTS